MKTKRVHLFYTFLQSQGRKKAAFFVWGTQLHKSNAAGDHIPHSNILCIYYLLIVALYTKLLIQQAVKSHRYLT